MPSQLAQQYDFIVCGSGSSGSVVARRLAENPDVSVLVLEAGGTGDVPEVTNAVRWVDNLGTDRDWAFVAQASPHLQGRALPLSMGKMLGGGSGINVMCWARGHRNDWDYFAAEAGDKSWSYEAVLDVYRRIEDWQGEPDPLRRGIGGPAFVQSAPDPHPIASAIVKGAECVGLPTFDSNNGVMMEGHGGAAIQDIRVRDGRRESVFDSYLRPHLGRQNLTVLTHALVTKLVLDGNRVSGVEFSRDGTTRRVRAGSEVIVSQGAIQTPKLLMQSGIGDTDELRRFGIPVSQHLPGVGRNYQDHALIPCLWEYPEPMPPRNCGSEATLFWKSDPALDTPDIHVCFIEFPFANETTAAQFTIPEHGWTPCVGVARPNSRGRVRLTGPNPSDPVKVDANLLSDPADMKAAIAGVELCREIAGSDPLRPFVKRAAAPGDLPRNELERYVRDAAETYWHQTCTAKMGRDEMSVVASDLKVYGVENLRIADGSIMPRITTGNTMAPCVVIGERAAEILKTEHVL